MDVLSTLATALVIGFGGYLVYEDELTVGVVAAFLIYVQQFFRPIQLASTVYTQAQAALAGGERIFAILDEPREPRGPARRRRAYRQSRGTVEFDRVTFAYVPGRAGPSRRLVPGRSGTAGGARRPDRGGQDDHRQPDSALLRHRRRRDHGSMATT